MVNRPIIFALAMVCCVSWRLGSASASPRQVKAWSVAVLGSDIEAAETAAAALGKDGSAAAVRGLLSALSLGLHPKVAVVALEGLGKNARSENFDTLVVYSRNRNQGVRAAAYEALAKIDDERAVARLGYALSDKSPAVRSIAIEHVSRVKDRSAMPALLRLIEAGDLHASRAFGSMGDAEDARKLAERVGSLPDGPLATALGAMLLRKEFGPDGARVQIVRTIAKLRTPVLRNVLNEYANQDKVGDRKSRDEASAVLESLSSPGRKQSE